MDLKDKLREGLTKNSLGVEITRPDQELIIMRGVSGAGKSTKAREVAGTNGIVHSTDDVIESKYDYREFFENMISTGNFSMLGKMHGENLNNTKQSIEKGVSPVVFDNTNIKAWEPKAVVEFGLKAGLADANIRVEDVGTSGLSAEELAARNSHGVPLDKINQMMASHKGVGELNIDKIMKSKSPHDKKRFFSSVVLDDKSKGKLLTALGHKIPKGWKTFAHHMTISFGKKLPEDMKADIGSSVNLRVTHLGTSDMAVAVRVDGYKSTNEIPHITIGVNVEAGGKPVMSNKITQWVELDSKLNLTGVVTEREMN